MLKSVSLFFVCNNVYIFRWSTYYFSNVKLMRRRVPYKKRGETITDLCYGPAVCNAWVGFQYIFYGLRLAGEARKVGHHWGNLLSCLTDSFRMFFKGKEIWFSCKQYKKCKNKIIQNSAFLLKHNLMLYHAIEWEFLSCHLFIALDEIFFLATQSHCNFINVIICILSRS